MNKELVKIDSYVHITFSFVSDMHITWNEWTRKH